MRLLVLGGTIFLGRHLVEAALQCGDDVTIFTRGQHNPDLFPDVEHLKGDRNSDLRVLEDKRWDVAVDTSGYFPRAVRASAELLAPAVEHYTFISSLSVYSDLAQDRIDETAAVGKLDDPTVEEITGETYGPLKALCEQEAERAMPGRTLVIRPGLIVGPHDPSDRFTYWPHRVALGGDVLAPGRPERKISFIDARDLAEWILRLAEARATGTFNADGPGKPASIGELLETCRTESGSDARFVWVPQDFLAEQSVEGWSDLPVWLPEDPDLRGFFSFATDRARAAGLTFRPVAETVRDTLAWDATRPADHVWRAGLTAEREAEVLAAYLLAQSRSASA